MDFTTRARLVLLAVLVIALDVLLGSPQLTPAVLGLVIGLTLAPSVLPNLQVELTYEAIADWLNRRVGNRPTE